MSKKCPFKFGAEPMTGTKCTQDECAWWTGERCAVQSIGFIADSALDLEILKVVGGLKYIADHQNDKERVDGISKPT